MTALVPACTRRRKSAVQIDNVVPMRAKPGTAESILADVEDHNRAASERLSLMLQEMTNDLQARRDARIEGLAHIGRALSPRALADWIKVGRRLAGWETGK